MLPVGRRMDADATADISISNCLLYVCGPQLPLPHEA